MGVIFKELIFLDAVFDSAKEAIFFLSSRLLEKGFVKDSFAENVWKREEKYPTGIPTQPYCVAIPHTDKEYVCRESVAFARVREEVNFKTILGTGEELPVKFIFLLATRDDDGHIEFIRQLMSVFQNADTLEKMAAAEDVDALYDILSVMNQQL